MQHVGLVFDERFERHVTGAGHPERPARLVAVARGLTEAGAVGCPRIDAVAAAPQDLERVHDAAYLRRAEESCAAGQPFVDVPDSAVCPESFEIAKLATGAVIAATHAVLAGRIRRAFCAVRPPGHHAERDAAMGFCLLNNIAVAARAAQHSGQAARVAIVDWDVHHGNGTQHAFEDDPSVLFISLHGHPLYLYPGTGFETERGVGAGLGATINLPLLPGTSDEAYRRVFEQSVVPAVDAFRPDLIMISAGFDAHADDPIGNLNLSDETYGWLTQRVVDLAEGHCRGRIVSVLEGGYNLDALGRSVREHVCALGG